MPIKSYDDLALVPSIVADAVCRKPYTGWENPEIGAALIAEIESRRSTMTPESVREFAELADRYCRDAYAAGAEWFLEIARSKTNRGRDQLYVWITHWLSAYLNDPEQFRRSLERVGPGIEVSNAS